MGLRVRTSAVAMAVIAIGTLVAPQRLRGQSVVPLSRSQAIETALARGARLGVARADTSAAFAALLTARAFQNPTLSTSYSKSTPQYHVTLDIPIDFPALRSARIGSAAAARQAAQYRFQFERAAVALDADTTYTRALAALEHSRLSRRNAADADSLLAIAVARERAGDASELDVELARVNAGQQENVAAADSLTFISTVLDLQAVLGLGSTLVIVPTDSLRAPPDTTAAIPNGRAVGAPLQVAAASATLQSATLAASIQSRSVFTAPSITAGFETRDPTGSEKGILPTFGIALPLPLFNRNSGPIAQARAERERAIAELTLARVQSETEIARALRERSTALVRVSRDRMLVASANRVAALSLTAYREGAATLASVLEAQRNARDVIGQYVDDLASVWIAIAELRAITLTPAGPTTGSVNR